MSKVMLRRTKMKIEKYNSFPSLKPPINHCWAHPSSPKNGSTQSLQYLKKKIKCLKNGTNNHLQWCLDRFENCHNLLRQRMLRKLRKHLWQLPCQSIGPSDLRIVCPAGPSSKLCEFIYPNFCLKWNSPPKNSTSYQYCKSLCSWKSWMLFSRGSCTRSSGIHNKRHKAWKSCSGKLFFQHRHYRHHLLRLHHHHCHRQSQHRGEREWLFGSWEWEREFKITFPHLGNGNETGKSIIKNLRESTGTAGNSIKNTCVEYL